MSYDYVFMWLVELSVIELSVTEMSAIQGGRPSGIGPITNWFDGPLPLVRKPIGPNKHWSENPLVRRPIAIGIGIGPKKCYWH